VVAVTRIASDRLRRVAILSFVIEFWNTAFACFSHLHFLWSDCGNMRPWKAMFLGYNMNKLL